MANDSISGLNLHIDLLINEVFFQPYVLPKLQIICNISDSSLIYLHQWDFIFQIKSILPHILPTAGITCKLLAVKFTQGEQFKVKQH